MNTQPLTTDRTPAGALRDLLADDGLITVPGVFDGISAALVRRAGFGAAYMTGAGVAASGFGLPDIGLVTQTETAERTSALVSALGGVPLIADADTGYGDPVHVVRTVERMERAGAAAIQLEDQAFPKRCGHLAGKEVVPADDFVHKIHAAVEARRDPDLVLVARTDARAELGLAEAIERGNKYAEAGADVVFVEAPRSLEEIRTIAAEVDAPLLVNMVQGGLTPDTSAEILADLGYRIAIHPGTPLAGMALTAAGELARLAGHDPFAVEGASGPEGFFNLLGLAEWTDLADRHSTPGSERP